MKAASTRSKRTRPTGGAVRSSRPSGSARAPAPAPLGQRKAARVGSAGTARIGSAKAPQVNVPATRRGFLPTSSQTKARGWGGARTGAGRPAKGPIASERHTTRPDLSAKHPVHVTSRVASRIGSRVRRNRAYAAIRRALHLSLGRIDFRIVHLAVLPTRIELIVEADDKVALARGMQGFQVSAARWLNGAARRAGTVFVDRYRMKVLRTPHAVRDAIGRLPLLRQTSWPQTWLLRVEVRLEHARWWFRTRGSEASS